MIRKAISADITTINEIYNHAIAAKYQTASMVKQTLSETEKWFNEHQRERYNIYVYIMDEKIVGWCSFSPFYDREATRHTAEISCYLHKDFQKMGLGSELMRFTLTEAKKLNFTILFATLINSNTTSCKILEKFGFQLWGELKNAANFDGKFFNVLYYGKELA